MKLWIWILIIVAVAVIAFVVARKTAPCCNKKAPVSTKEVVANTTQVPNKGEGLNYEETKKDTKEKVAEKFAEQVNV